MSGYSHTNVVRALNANESYGKRAGFSTAMSGRIGTDTSIHAATRATKLAALRAKKNLERAQKLEEAFQEEQAKAEELARKLQLRKERILKRQARQRELNRAADTIQRFFVHIRDREAREDGAVALQSVWRAFAAQHRLWRVRRATATLIRASRMYLAKRTRQRLSEERERAAQAARDELARQIAAREKAEAEARAARERAAHAAAEEKRRHANAAAIQNKFRQHRHVRRRASAELIQRTWRASRGLLEGEGVQHGQHDRPLMVETRRVGPKRPPKRATAEGGALLASPKSKYHGRQQQIVVSPLNSPRNRDAAVDDGAAQGRERRDNTHLKSVQRTMQVSNMQKWMPAFKRLEAKFADSDMTDEEKQEALKTMAIKEIKRAKWKQESAARDAKLLRIQQRKAERRQRELEEQAAEERAKENARLQWHKDSKAKEARLQKARERAERKRQKKLAQERREEAEKKAQRAAQIREVLRRSEIRDEKRELQEYKARAEAAAAAEREAKEKMRREEELKVLARQRRRNRARALKRAEERQAAEEAKAAELERERQAALKESQAAYAERLEREAAERADRRAREKQAAAEAAYERELEEEEKARKVEEYRKAAKERVRKKVKKEKKKMRRHLLAIAAAQKMLSPNSLRLLKEEESANRSKKQKKKSRKREQSKTGTANRTAGPESAAYTPFEGDDNDSDQEDDYDDDRYDEAEDSQASDSTRTRRIPDTSRSANDAAASRRRLHTGRTSRSEGNSTTDSEDDSDDNTSGGSDNDEPVVPPLDLVGVDGPLAGDASEPGMSEQEKRARAKIEMAKRQLAEMQKERRHQQKASKSEGANSTRHTSHSTPNISPVLVSSEQHLNAAINSPGPPQLRKKGKGPSALLDAVQWARKQKTKTKGKQKVKSKAPTKKARRAKRQQKKQNARALDSMIEDTFRNQKDAWKRQQRRQLNLHPSTLTPSAGMDSPSGSTLSPATVTGGKHDAESVAAAKKDRASRWLAHPTPGGADTPGGGLHSSAAAAALFGGKNGEPGRDGGGDIELDMFSRMRPRPKLSLMSSPASVRTGGIRRKKVKKASAKASGKAKSAANEAAKRSGGRDKKLSRARAAEVAASSDKAEVAKAELKLSPRNVQDSAVLAMMFADDDDSDESSEDESSEESGSDGVGDDDDNDDNNVGEVETDADDSNDELEGGASEENMHSDQVSGRVSGTSVAGSHNGDEDDRRQREGTEEDDDEDYDDDDFEDDYGDDDFDD